MSKPMKWFLKGVAVFLCAYIFVWIVIYRERLAAQHIRFRENPATRVGI